VFAVVAPQIADAAEEARSPTELSLKDDEMQELVRVDPVSGQRIVEFRGLRSFIRQQFPNRNRRPRLRTPQEL
jgi:hypothetical protein